VDELFREQEVYGVKNIYIKAPNWCVVLYKPILEQTSPLQITLTQPTQQSTRTQNRKKKRDAGNIIHFLRIRI